MIHLAAVVFMAVGLVPAAQGGGAAVKPIGVFPLLLPGLQATPAGRPKVHLWCQGGKLLGLLGPEETAVPARPAGSAPGRSLPSAVLLRDGHCEAEGGNVSFGFLLPIRAWVYDSTVRATPEERTTWLLHRFQGTVAGGQMKGVLTQVDFSHPGHAFPEVKVDVVSAGPEQSPFGDEKAWLENAARSYGVIRSQP